MTPADEARLLEMGLCWDEILCAQSHDGCLFWEGV